MSLPLIALTIGLVFLIIGVALWLPPRREASRASDLGAAIVGGALVAGAVLMFQTMIDRKADERDAAAQKREEASDERLSLELTLGLQKDLTGIGLSGRNLSTIYLRGKNLSNSDLSNVMAVGTNFQQANLTGADLSDSNLTGAFFEGADLSGAKLTRATLDCAKLTGAVLIAADFSGASLAGADLSEVRTDSSTKLPPSQPRDCTRIEKGLERVDEGQTPPARRRRR